MPDGKIPRRVVVKFQDTVDLPYEDGAEKHLERVGIQGWADLAARFKGIRLERPLTLLPPDKLGDLVAQATERDRHYQPPNLLSYFTVDAPADADASALASELRSWPQVEDAYVDPQDASPGMPTGSNPEYVQGKQGYLKPPAVAAPPSPQGAIDAEFAWLQPGGNGALQKFVDLERGANLDQEDIDTIPIPLLHGINSSTPQDRLHGARVFCVVVGADNNLGVVGIAFGADGAAYSSQVMSNTPGVPVKRPQAVLAAILHFLGVTGGPVGRVLLLEVELGPANDASSLTDFNGVVWNQMPMETAPLDFEMIRLASALGIIVVEAAGNGGNNLDLFRRAGSGKFILSREHPMDFKESGAIMVGGSTANFPYRALIGGVQRTNFGSRVDCFAWAEGVHTCNAVGYGNTFGGSSSASAIVAGAALLIQGLTEGALAPRLGPMPMRALLADPDLNTHSANYGVDKIGVMPNLKRIIQDGLGLAPDVYLRDNVNDAGDVHAGVISMSPDIIVRGAAVANPSVTFGPGTENDMTLGSTVMDGQPNFVYVRVWNRGSVAATNVTATVFFAPPSTLLLGDAWTKIDSVVIPSVPPNNVMTVSPPIVWPAAAVPPAGHYCFIGLVGHAQDPAPPAAAFLNFDNYCAFIRNNNNVTWRNFDVVSPLLGVPSGLGVDGADAFKLEFEARGDPDNERPFQFVVGASLPSGGRVLLDAPLHLLDTGRLPGVERDGSRGRVAVGAHGRTRLPAIVFPKKTRELCRLLVQVPRDRDQHYDVYVSQLYEGFEVGRITWRITARP